MIPERLAEQFKSFKEMLFCLFIAMMVWIAFYDCSTITKKELLEDFNNYTINAIKPVDFDITEPIDIAKMETCEYILDVYNHGKDTAATVRVLCDVCDGPLAVHCRVVEIIEIKK